MGWKFLCDRSGNTAVIFTVCATVVVGAAGVAVDYSSLSRHRSELQNVADAAALASIRALGLLEGRKINSSRISGAEEEGEVILKSSGVPMQKKSVVLDTDAMTSTVTVFSDRELTIAKVLGLSNVRISARAVAGAVQTPSACVIALDQAAVEGIRFSTSGALEALGCAVWSNSLSPTSITGGGSGYAAASAICSSGGVNVGSGFTFTPGVYTSCQPIADPLASYVQPAPGPCNFFNTSLSGGGSHVLNPGVYCGGISMQGNATVEFKPGIYHIVDGRLKIGAGANAKGTGVSFVATGIGSAIDFTGSADVTFSAPTSGVTEGILFSSARGAAPEESSVTGSVNLHIEGAIYLPTHNVKVAGKSSLAIPPTHSLLIAGTFHFASTLVQVRSDYEAATMKAPAGMAYTGIRMME